MGGRRAGAVVVLALTAAVMPACGATSPDAPPRPRRAPSAAPVTGPPTADHWYCGGSDPPTVDDYRAAFAHSDPAWRVADGGKPVALPDGRVLWIFADTIVGELEGDGTLAHGRWRMPHSSLIVEDEGCFDPVFGGDEVAESLIPDEPSGTYHWPSSGWVDPSGAAVHVLAGRITPTPALPPGYRHDRSVIATFALPGLELLGVTPIPAPIAFTSAVSDAAHVYLYSADREPGRSLLARFPLRAGPPALDQLDHWDGAGWDPRPDRRRPLEIDEPLHGGMLVTGAPGRWMALGRSGSLFNEPIDLWEAPRPEGPWRRTRTVVAAPAKPGLGTYAPHVVSLPDRPEMVVYSTIADRPGAPAGAGIHVEPLGPG